MRPLFVIDRNIPFAGEMYADLADVRLLDGHDITPTTVREAHVLLVRSVTPVTRELLEGSRVRFVGTATIGHDHVDRSYLDRAGIVFASAPGSNANAVSEYVVAALLEISARTAQSLRGKSIGVIGVGNVGRRIVRKAEVLGLRVVKNDPPLQRQTGDNQFVSLDEALSADIVSCHVPLTHTGLDATYHLLDESRLNRMKPGAVLINTARGAVVDGTALKTKLRAARLSAVLDVWEGEPRIDEELLDVVHIGTPHIAGHSTDGKANGAVMLYESVCRHLGCQATWTIQGKLPVPAISSIDATGDNDESIVRSVVRIAYPIHEDDARLREMLTLDPHRRADHFSRLRSRYPVRREFAALTARLRSASPAVRKTLQDLGFNVSAE